MAAREGLSRQPRRAAIRAVRRGTAAEDPTAARFAVALGNELSHAHTLSDTVVIALLLAMVFVYTLWR